MLYRETLKTIDNILFPAKTSPIKDEEDRTAIVLACETLKIVENISERFKEFPEEVQDAFMEFRIFQNEHRSSEVNDCAYRFVTETMDEIEYLEDTEKERNKPI